MKKPSTKTNREPSAASLREIPEVTRDAFEQAERGELMTLSPELMDRIAETGIVPAFVRDPA